MSEAAGVVTISATDTNTTYSAMTTTTLGLGKIRYATGSTPAAEDQSTTANRTYGVTKNSSNQLVVNVPWVDTDNNTQRSAGTGLSLNGNQLDVNVGATGTTITPQSISTTSNRLYQIETDDEDNLVVNVPWSNTNTQRGAGTGLSLNGNNIDANVDGTNSEAPQTSTTTSGRTYKVQVDSNDNLVVNVPWSDTDNDTIDMGDGFTVSADTDTATTTITEGDTLTIAGGTGISTTSNPDGTITITSSVSNTDVDVSVTNLETRLGQIDSDINIGDSSGPTVTIPGNLVVEGTTTTVESTVTTFTDPIIELNKVAGSGTQADPTTSSGIEVKRAGIGDVQLVWMEDSDDWEFQAYDHSATPTKRKYKIPTSYKATIGDSNAAAGSYSETVTHNLGTKDVIVQCYDTSSYETVYADVVRTSDNVVTLTFASAPTDNDVTVLIISAQGQQ